MNVRLGLMKMAHQCIQFTLSSGFWEGLDADVIYDIEVRIVDKRRAMQQPAGTLQSLAVPRELLALLRQLVGQHLERNAIPQGEDRRTRLLRHSVSSLNITTESRSLQG